MKHHIRLGWAALAATLTGTVLSFLPSWTLVFPSAAKQPAAWISDFTFTYLSFGPLIAAVLSIAVLLWGASRLLRAQRIHRFAWISMTLATALPFVPLIGLREDAYPTTLGWFIPPIFALGTAA